MRANPGRVGGGAEQRFKYTCSDFSFRKTSPFMSAKLLDCIDSPTGEPCEYSVIWLHGLGASGHDFEPIVPTLELLSRPGVRFVFPHAPVRPITVNGGASMRAWYDIASIDFESRQQDEVGIRESAEAVDQLIEQEIKRGVPASNIILAGFSQGGAIALYTGLCSKHQIGGILALSTYLPLQTDVLPLIQDKHQLIPVFMAHGISDDVIALRHGEQTRATLEASGLRIEWHTYSIAHSVSAEEVADISLWLKRQFGM